MPWVGFEPMIPASERAKTVHALDRSPTVTGHFTSYHCEFQKECREIGHNPFHPEPIEL
jgi:hypothetical protein